MRKTTKMVAVLAAMSVMVLGAATMVSADKKQGWVKEGSDWYYYNNGDEIQNGWAQDGAGLWYFLGEDGKMVKEEFVDNKVGLVVASGEVQHGDDSDYYYVDADGVMVTGWAEIKTSSTGDGPTKDDKKTWFYFGASGVMYAEEWVLSGSNWYWVNEHGRMLKKTIVEYDDKNYYLDKNGVNVTGWYKTTSDDSIFSDSGKWIYANADGELVDQGWEKVDGTWYYFGTVTADAIASPSSVGDVYEMVSDTFIEVDGEFFYLKSSGAMATGLVKVDGKHYFAKSNGTLQNGVQTVSGRYYFFDTTTYERKDSVDYVLEVKVTDNPTAYTLNVVDSDSEARAYIKDEDNNLAKGNTIYKLKTATKFVK